MTLSTLRTLCRIFIPEISSTDVLSSTNLDILINLAATEFIKETDALPTSGLFTVSTNTQTYAISTFITTFGKIRKEGIWYYNGSTSKWNQLDGTTIAYLNKNFSSWLNASSGLPMRYWIEGNEIGFDPKPSSTYAGTDYVKIFYYKRSVDMTADTHYPFSGSTTQYPHLANYEEVLFDWIKYRVKQIIGKGGDAEEAKGLFYIKCAGIRQNLVYRPDLIPDHKLRGL